MPTFSDCTEYRTTEEELLNLGNYIKYDTTWDGIDRDFPFITMGRSDAEYAAELEKRHSVSGGTVFLCGAIIFAFSRMQKCVALSVTEAEYVAAVEVVQNMLSHGGYCSRLVSR
jgi:hypothetical protein